MKSETFLTLHRQQHNNHEAQKGSKDIVKIVISGLTLIYMKLREYFCVQRKRFLRWTKALQVWNNTRVSN